MPTLEWLNKKDAVKAADKIPYKLLNIKPELSYGEQNGSMIIKGDNLEALKTLLPYYKGQVKCIYIDPPYNTGSAFEHYDDNLEHSTWLSMMYPRLELLRELLAENGSIWISIDDDEQAYLKVICDEIFGRKNFVNNVIWQKKYSPANDTRWLSDNHDFIIVYAKNKNLWEPNLLPRSDTMNARYKNIDNDPRGLWKPGGFSVKTYTKEYDYSITTPTGRIVYPPSGSCWQNKIGKYRTEAYVKAYRDLFVSLSQNIETKSSFLFKFGQEYQPLSIYEGTTKFNKHLYEHIGAMNKEEENCAAVIDSLEEVKYWARNIERSNYSFFLPTSTDRFYPDFIALLTDGRILAVEYKGGHLLSTDDTKEKENIGRLWQEKSGGKCLFMLSSKENLERQIIDKIKEE
ncbi:MAG: hypothetical protein Ta2C_07310 [Candidatus Endomicrobiellum trichonymphae]|uniref:site-specific DNA-methyltransferase n=1 Tax=Endomicrobium trichonymphae TaxID=1408204 RepID=UPI0027D37B9A|nr:MAG: hypothetical protein Ta2C_07310 [Candidatus Endomicrobium trichonymphae]